MENSIDAQIEFSFKGQTYADSATINLDELMERRGALPSMHGILADRMEIDAYSYLYEVMLESEISFTNARGLAAAFVSDGAFDFEAFMAAWQENKVLGLLQSIAEREMGIADLADHPALKKALFQAYQAGTGL